MIFVEVVCKQYKSDVVTSKSESFCICQYELILIVNGMRNPNNRIDIIVAWMPWSFTTLSTYFTYIELMNYDRKEMKGKAFSREIHLLLKRMPHPVGFKPEQLA